MVETPRKEKNMAERTPEFEEKVKHQETETFTKEELEMMTDEEFALVIPALGPAQAAEAEMIRARSADKRKGTGPARELSKQV